MELSDVLNFIAILFAPIVSVWIAQKLQDRDKKRQDKMYIFRTLMTDRIYGWTTQSVNALNVIDIVFADTPKVRKQWQEYYDKLCVENPTGTEIKKIQNSRDKLLETMAVSLGYKNKISWETIQNPYIPKGMTDAMNQQQQFQMGQLEIVKKLSTISNNNGGNTNGQNENGICKSHGQEH